MYKLLSKIFPSWYNKNTTQKWVSGFTIIEVIIASSIISISTFALMQTAQKGISLSSLALHKSQASLLLEEGAEAIKSIRDNNWADISNATLGTTYHLFFNTNTNLWILDTSTTNLSGHSPAYPIDSAFGRTVVISSVGRDSNDDIIDSGGVLDSGTKKVIVKVEWTSSDGLKSKSLPFYLSNIFN